MAHRSFILTAISALLVLGIGLASAADNPPPPDHSRDHDHDRGFLPWTSEGFFPFVTAPADNNAPSPSQPRLIDLGPALAGAAYADAQCDRAYSDMMVTIDRARADFGNSPEYVSAQRDVQQTVAAYEAAASPPLAQVHGDAAYRNLIEQRTEVEIAMKSTAVHTAMRNVLAAEKMKYGAQASELEAAALTNDSNVQQAKAHLVTAQQALTQKQVQFESSLYNRPDVAAARHAWETACANQAAARGYLAGQRIARDDQLNAQAAQANSGNVAYQTPWNPYWRGYYGIGW